MGIIYNEEGQYVKNVEKKIEVDTEKKVHSLILQRNRRHLGQARKTPFVTRKWAKKLKWDGTGDLGKDILSGSILNKEIFGSTVQMYFGSLKKTKFSRVENCETKSKYGGIQSLLEVETRRDRYITIWTPYRTL